MKIALLAHDKSDSLDLRMATREAHVAYLKSSDVVEQAGPILDDAGAMIGSLIILNVDDIAQAQAWAAADPYANAGLFQLVQLIPWNRVIG
jgi:uncharacterized protein YciI